MRRGVLRTAYQDAALSAPLPARKRQPGARGGSAFGSKAGVPGAAAPASGVIASQSPCFGVAFRNDHPAFEKEDILGAQTGDYICTQCGECFSPADRTELDEKRKAITPDRRT